MLPLSAGLKSGSGYKFSDHDVVLGESAQRYVLRVRDLPSQEKPREKLVRRGPHELSVAELVAVLWGVGTKKEEVLVMARRITKEYGEKSVAAETDARKLAESL